MYSINILIMGSTLAQTSWQHTESNMDIFVLHQDLQRSHSYLLPNVCCRRSYHVPIRGVAPWTLQQLRFSLGASGTLIILQVTGTSSIGLDHPRSMG